jgi:hypothetical protein
MYWQLSSSSCQPGWFDPDRDSDLDLDLRLVLLCLSIPMPSGPQPVARGLLATIYSRLSGRDPLSSGIDCSSSLVPLRFVPRVSCPVSRSGKLNTAPRSEVQP